MDKDASGASAAPEWVKIVSEEGFEFILPRKVAIASGTLANMLDMESSFAESATNTCHLQERAAVVQIVLEYLMYKHLYSTAGPKDEVPDFQERVPPELALELLMAADYLET